MDKKPTDKDKKLADNLRANLLRRKAAAKPKEKSEK